MVPEYNECVFGFSILISLPLGTTIPFWRDKSCPRGSGSLHSGNSNNLELQWVILIKNKKQKQKTKYWAFSPSLPLCSCLQSLSLKKSFWGSPLIEFFNSTRQSLWAFLLALLFSTPSTSFWWGSKRITYPCFSLLPSGWPVFPLSSVTRLLKHFLLFQFNSSLLGATDIKSHPTALYSNLWVTDLSSPREGKSLESKDYFFFFCLYSPSTGDCACQIRANG